MDLGPDRRRDLLGAEVHVGADQLPQLLDRDLAVIEGDLATVLELLPLLVPLAGDHDHVARPGAPEREGDRGAAVDLDLDRGPLRDPGDDLGDDRLRIL